LLKKIACIEIYIYGVFMNLRILVLTIVVFSFFISCSDNGTNIDNSIQTVTIGNQKWMLKNLDVEVYRNGDTIPQVTDPVAWVKLTTGAWCYYDNNPANGVIYGKLYNWYAVNDSRGLAPAGYHVPTDVEWKTLEMYLGMDQIEADKIMWRGTDQGSKLKETGTSHWESPNSDAVNSTGFTGLPGGYRSDSGLFGIINTNGVWWSSTEKDDQTAWDRYLGNTNANIDRGSYSKKDGYSVRCLKD
jgi:uncharacterized protein (TIGR02145 family)